MHLSHSGSHTYQSLYLVRSSSGSLLLRLNLFWEMKEDDRGGMRSMVRENFLSEKKDIYIRTYDVDATKVAT